MNNAISDIPVPWRLSDDTPKIMYVDQILMKGDCLSVDLKDAVVSDFRMRIIFESYIAFQSIDETYRNVTYASVEYDNGSLVLITNSSWIKWLNDESGGLLLSIHDSVTHYGIWTDDEYIDIATPFEPTIIYNY